MTINLPADARFADYRTVFSRANQLGLKGCTLFRPERGREGVLSAPDAGIANAWP